MEYEIGGRWGYRWCVGSPSSLPDGMERVARMASESAVVVFSRSGCCMCHAVKRLLCGMGVNPRVHELDRHPFGKDMERALMTLLRSSSSVSVSVSAASALPVVFIGGNVVGAIDSVLASHINGSLVPLLKQAGALWL